MGLRAEGSGLRVEGLGLSIARCYLVAPLGERNHMNISSLIPRPAPSAFQLVPLTLYILRPAPSTLHPQPSKTPKL